MSARALLGWTTVDLARRAGIAAVTIIRMACAENILGEATSRQDLDTALDCLSLFLGIEIGAPDVLVDLPKRALLLTHMVEDKAGDRRASELLVRQEAMLACDHSVATRNKENAAVQKPRSADDFKKGDDTLSEEEIKRRYRAKQRGEQPSSTGAGTG
jgi:hypothetical protein